MKKGVALHFFALPSDVDKTNVKYSTLSKGSPEKLAQSDFFFLKSHQEFHSTVTSQDISPIMGVL